MRKLEKIYQSLYSHYGDLQWGNTTPPYEVIVGAILTQNTSWTNVEKAMNVLKGFYRRSGSWTCPRRASGNYPPCGFLQAKVTVPESRHRMVYEL